jgi:hypothetical protein
MNLVRIDMISWKFIIGIGINRLKLNISKAYRKGV